MIEQEKTFLDFLEIRLVSHQTNRTAFDKFGSGFPAGPAVSAGFKCGIYY